MSSLHHTVFFKIRKHCPRYICMTVVAYNYVIYESVENIFKYTCKEVSYPEFKLNLLTSKG